MSANNLAIQFSTCSSLSERWSVPVHPPTGPGAFSSALDWFWSRPNELPPCWRGLAAGLHPITQNAAAIPRTYFNRLVYFYSIDLVIISSLPGPKTTSPQGHTEPHHTRSPAWCQTQGWQDWTVFLKKPTPRASSPAQELLHTGLSLLLLPSCVYTSAHGTLTSHWRQSALPPQPSLPPSSLIPIWVAAFGLALCTFYLLC